MAHWPCSQGLVCYTFVKGMALTAASTFSRRAAFLLTHPSSKEIPVLYLPFKNVYMGIGLKSCVHTYQRTSPHPPAESSTNGSVGGFAYRRLSRSALGRTPPPSAVFKIIVMGIKKKNRTHFRFGKSVSDYTDLVWETGLDSHGSPPLSQRRSQATLWPDSLRLLQVLFLP